MTAARRHLVYFAYLGDADDDGELLRVRIGFMTRQLRWLAALIDAALETYEVIVPYVAPAAWDAEVQHAIEACGFRVDPSSLAGDRSNRFEYPGFAAMQTLARSLDPGDLIYYCHSKGIVHLEEAKMGLFRLHTEVGLTADLGDFARRADLTRAGLFPYRFGWCWYNFFWVKAGYMAGKTVVESADRYAFEALIGERGNPEAYRGVLPLIDRLPYSVTGIVPKPWYRGEETTTPTLTASYERYAAMDAPPAPSFAET